MGSEEQKLKSLIVIEFNSLLHQTIKPLNFQTNKLLNSQIKRPQEK